MRTIFVTGMGRSGTKHLAQILSQVVDADVHHECIGDRSFWLLSWYLEAEIFAIPYLQTEREKLNVSKDWFVDVNSYLQHCIPALRHVFHPQEVFHLVRDPRLVIRSIYIRRNVKDLNIIPKDRSGVDFWISADKFDQICWNWVTATKNLLEVDTKLVRFEELISDYNYFRTNLLAPFGFEMSEDAWSAVNRKKTNRTIPRWYRRYYAFFSGKQFVSEEIPHYANWTTRQKRTFTQICGDTMKRVGYEL